MITKAESQLLQTSGAENNQDPAEAIATRCAFTAPAGTAYHVKDACKGWGLAVFSPHGFRPPRRVPRRNVSRARVVFTWAVFFFVVISMLTVWWMDRQLSRPLKDWAELRVRTLGQRAITSAIQEILATEMETMDHEVIRQLSGGPDGTAAWAYDWARLHRVDAEITWRIMQNLDQQLSEDIPVPLGELLGIEFLAGAGPLMPVRIVPAGATSTELRFVFRSVGINQVLHQIAVWVNLRMRVIAPMVSDNFEVTQEIPLSTVILQGRVPQVFVNWGSGSLDDFIEQFSQSNSAAAFNSLSI